MPEPPKQAFFLVRTAILRLLGLVYLVAFVSTVRQGPALVGEHGLMPAGTWLEDVARVSGSRFAGFLRLPSIFWVDASDGAIITASIVGAVLALAVMAGVTNAGVMLVLWTIQLSLHSIGQVFWGYGWEIQLLETGMLAALLCPMRTWRPFASAPPPIEVIWLMRWLIVRIMLGAGLIKLRGDACWRDLTCLVYHYETQPNPSPMSWVLHHMPRPVHVAGALFNHVVELGAPLLVLGPRNARRVAGVLFVVFQIVLIVSGNLAFLNWLTIVPALACFDDAFLVRLVPARLRAFAMRATSETSPARLHVLVVRGYAALVFAFSIPVVLNLASSEQRMNASFTPLHLVNTYGAFGTVSRVRHEVILQGTRDETVDLRTHWEEYELPCKPGDVMRRPCLVSPYHYRLDWQMWFAAMSSYEDEPWIAALVDKLLRGDRSVAPLFARDPFPDPAAPPRFVRAELYRYELTPRGSSAWWTRTRIGEYMRPMAKDDPELAAFLRENGFRKGSR